MHSVIDGGAEVVVMNRLNFDQAHLSNNKRFMPWLHVKLNYFEIIVKLF